MRWHNKPPVNGRELTADDVVYTRRALPHRQGQRQRLHAGVGRQGRGARQVHGASSRSRSRSPGSSTCSPTRMAVGHRRQGVRREVRRPQEARGGRRHRARGCSTATGRTSGITLVRNPSYFVPGLPYIDRIEVVRRRGQCLAHGRVPRRQVRPRLGVPGHDQPHRLGADQGHAQAEAARTSRRGVPVQRHEPHLDAHRQDAVQRRARAPGDVAWPSTARASSTRPARASASINPPVPAALKEWAIPIDQLGEGAQYYKHDPAEAKRLLAAAGYPNGFPATHVLHHLRLHRPRRHRCSSS